MTTASNLKDNQFLFVEWSLLGKKLTAIVQMDMDLGEEIHYRWALFPAGVDREGPQIMQNNKMLWLDGRGFRAATEEEVHELKKAIVKHCFKL